MSPIKSENVSQTELGSSNLKKVTNGTCVNEIMPYKKDTAEVNGPVGCNHGSLARAHARGAGSPWTAQSLLLAL